MADPTLDLLFLSESNDRHSGRLSWTLSDDTRPHLLHAISPDSKSVTSCWPLPHIQDIIEDFIIIIRNDLVSYGINNSIYAIQLYKQDYSFTPFIVFLGIATGILLAPA